MLNGRSIRLGTAGSVIDSASGGRQCEITLQDDRTPYRWLFEGEPTSTSMEVRRVSVGDLQVTETETLRHLLPSPADGSLLASCLYGSYLPANRLKPLEVPPGRNVEPMTTADLPRERASRAPYAGADQSAPQGLTLVDFSARDAAAG